METTYTIYVQLAKEETELELDICYEITSDGIGSYEFWGFRGFDKGQTECIIESIIYEGNFSAEDRKLIEVEIDKNLSDIQQYCIKDAKDKKADAEVDEADAYRKYGEFA
jgi:hypothetical protein